MHVNILTGYLNTGQLVFGLFSLLFTKSINKIELLVNLLMLLMMY